MREFKFRVWDLIDSEMYTMGSLYHKGNYVFNYECPVVDFYKESNPNGIRCNRIDEVKIMQCTGLTDVNGKEIYEGDILEHRNEEDEYTFLTIKWDKYQFVAEDFYDASQDVPHDLFSEYAYKRCKVIGNIYENPELLGE